MGWGRALTSETWPSQQQPGPAQLSLFLGGDGLRSGAVSPGSAGALPTGRAFPSYSAIFSRSTRQNSSLSSTSISSVSMYATAHIVIERPTMESRSSMAAHFPW